MAVNTKHSPLYAGFNTKDEGLMKLFFENLFEICLIYFGYKGLKRRDTWNEGTLGAVVTLATIIFKTITFAKCRKLCFHPCLSVNNIT